MGIFIDEVGVNLHTSEKYGYAPSGITPGEYRRPQRGIHFSINCVIAHDRIVAYEVLDEPASGTTFAKFLYKVPPGFLATSWWITRPYTKRQKWKHGWMIQLWILMWYI